MAVNLAHNPGALSPRTCGRTPSGGVAGGARAGRHTRGHVQRAHDAGLAADRVRHSPPQLQEVPVPAVGAGEVLVKVAGNGLCHSDVGMMEAGRRGPALPQLAAAVHARPRDRRLGRGDRRGRERLLARTAGDPRGHALGWHLRVLPRGTGQQLRRGQRRPRLRTRWRPCALRAPDERPPAHCAQESRPAHRRSPGGRRGDLDARRAARAAAARPAARAPSSSAPAASAASPCSCCARSRRRA